MEDWKKLSAERLFTAEEKDLFLKFSEDQRMSSFELDPGEVELIKYMIHFHENSLELLEELYTMNKRVINSRIADIQKKCPHPKTTYYPDASGNNDSCYVCNVCGLEKKRF